MSAAGGRRRSVHTSGGPEWRSQPVRELPTVIPSARDPSTSARRHRRGLPLTRRSGERSTPSGRERRQVRATKLGARGEPLTAAPLATGRGRAAAPYVLRVSRRRGLREHSERLIARLRSPDTAQRRRFDRWRTRKFPRPFPASPGAARCRGTKSGEEPSGGPGEVRLRVWL